MAINVFTDWEDISLPNGKFLRGDSQDVAELVTAEDIVSSAGGAIHSVSKVISSNFVIPADSVYFNHDMIVNDGVEFTINDNADLIII